MKTICCKGLFVGLALLLSASAQSAAILNPPASVFVGDNFDVTVSFDVDPVLAPGESIIGFGFDVQSLTGLTLTGASANPLLFADSTAGNNVAGFSLLGVVSNNVLLATLSFSADSVGVGSGSIFGDGLFGGLQIQDSLSLAQRSLTIGGDFSVEILDAAAVPLPGTIGLLALGLLGLVRRTRAAS